MHEGAALSRDAPPRQPLAQLSLPGVVFALFLAVLTVWAQLDYVGADYLVDTQLKRHRMVLEGKSGDPWQYRLLTEFVAEGFVRLAAWAGAEQPVPMGFALCRLTQNIVLFLIVALYFRQLGLSPRAADLGQIVLAWGILNSFYNADLQFSTYTDVIAYLLAGLLILTGRDTWILPLGLLAVLNRETSMLIPVMLLASRVELRPRITLPARVAWLSGLTLAGQLGIHMLLRQLYGPRMVLVPTGRYLSWELLRENLTDGHTWFLVLTTLSLVPALALLAYRRWPEVLRRILWAVVPAWLLVHLFLSKLSETRLLLVPFALVFIPGALFALKRDPTSDPGS